MHDFKLGLLGGFVLGFVAFWVVTEIEGIFRRRRLLRAVKSLSQDEYLFWDTPEGREYAAKMERLIGSPGSLGQRLSGLRSRGFQRINNPRDRNA